TGGRPGHIGAAEEGQALLLLEDDPLSRRDGSSRLAIEPVPLQRADDPIPELRAEAGGKMERTRARVRQLYAVAKVSALLNAGRKLECDLERPVLRTGMRRWEPRPHEERDA